MHILIAYLLFVMFPETLCERISKMIEMPITDVAEEDTYLCTVVLFEDINEGYVVSMNYTVDETRVHHMSTLVCEDPISTEEIWECGKTQGQNSRAASVNLVVWSKITPVEGTFQFPQGVAVKIGSKTKFKYFMMQIHYRTKLRVEDQIKPAATVVLIIDDKPRPLSYQMYSLTNSGYIPPNKNKGYFSNTACEWKLPPAYALRYYTHTHHHGIMADGFIVRNKTWILLGSALSQKMGKVAYDVPGGPMKIMEGDILAGRCLYINNENKPVLFGLKDTEEMCGFTLEIGFDPKYENDFPRSMSCDSLSPKFDFCKFKDRLGFC